MAAARNRVRIVGGRWRSRVIRFPPAEQLRPTPDRVRETLFNWLGQRLDGLACLDLFAGSGALGFEALSRGAARVVLVEGDRAVAAALRQSAKLLGAKDAEVVVGDAISYLDRCAERFDVVFLDPPYASDLALRAIERLEPRLNPGARVYLESAGGAEPPAPWHALRQDRAGTVRYGLYEIQR
ncbi:MAG TPA: 16S rRNA (guanine(966)-N(2))-methyltransferase RsmD [Usitatibacter sp.]|nr:16S rRNA (guanine(966)-N(2))-methyltransferase RsmD [Usitatibacter sp.]